MPAIELESKLELSEADFCRVLASGEVKKRIRQLNIYYDIDGVLSRAGITLRVRLSPGRDPLLTLKVPVKQEGARREAQEVEAPLSRGSCWRIAERPAWVVVDRDLPEEYRAILRSLGVSNLQRIGWMRNDRWIVEVCGAQLELDRTDLPGGVEFYEAEIESSDLDVHRRLVEWIEQVAQSARPSSISKFERFAQALKQKVSSDGRV